MAKCFNVVGYVEPCNAVRQKYTGRALLITADSMGATVQNSTTFIDNGIKVSQIDNSQDFVNFKEDWRGNIVNVVIDVQNPFGVTIQGNTDSDRVMYKKTIPVTIPATRDGKAEEFIMGLQKGLYGSAAVVLETFGIPDNNDFFGAYSPVILDPTSVTRSEYENGGAWQFNLVCEEPIPNVVCSMTKLKDALDAMEV